MADKLREKVKQAFDKLYTDVTFRYGGSGGTVTQFCSEVASTLTFIRQGIVWREQHEEKTVEEGSEFAESAGIPAEFRNAGSGEAKVYLQQKIDVLKEMQDQLRDLNIVPTGDEAFITKEQIRAFKGAAGFFEEIAEFLRAQDAKDYNSEIRDLTKAASELRKATQTIPDIEIE